MKPILTLLLSGIYYGFIAVFFLVEIIWSLSFSKAWKATKIVWCAEDELNRNTTKYWYYRTPLDHVYGRKKWTTRHYDSLF